MRGGEAAKGFVFSVTLPLRWLTGRHFRTHSTILTRLRGTEAKYLRRSLITFDSGQGCIVFIFAGFDVVTSLITFNPFTSLVG